MPFHCLLSIYFFAYLLMDIASEQEAEAQLEEQRLVAGQLQEALEAEAAEHADWVERAASAWALERAAHSKRLHAATQDSQVLLHA